MTLSPFRSWQSPKRGSFRVHLSHSKGEPSCPKKSWWPGHSSDSSRCMLCNIPCFSLLFMWSPQSTRSLLWVRRVCFHNERIQCSTYFHFHGRENPLFMPLSEEIKILTWGKPVHFFFLLLFPYKEMAVTNREKVGLQGRKIRTLPLYRRILLLHKQTGVGKIWFNLIFIEEELANGTWGDVYITAFSQTSFLSFDENTSLYEKKKTIKISVVFRVLEGVG